MRDELLATLERELAHIPALRLWADTQIRPGDEWQQEIVRAMRRTRVAVFLVSKAFLASPFIRGDEEPFFVKAAKANVLTVLWVNLDIDLGQPDESGRIRDLAGFQAMNQAPVRHSENRQSVWEAVAADIERALRGE